eukprot:354654-Chlamydomonas_euryale.AAC.4
MAAGVKSDGAAARSYSRRLRKCETAAETAQGTKTNSSCGRPERDVTEVDGRCASAIILSSVLPTNGLAPLRVLRDVVVCLVACPAVGR